MAVRDWHEPNWNCIDNRCRAAKAGLRFLLLTCFAILVSVNAAAAHSLLGIPATGHEATRERSQMPGEKKIRLVPGVPIEGKMSSAEVLSYEIKLEAGEFIHAVVDQHGIDLIVTFYQPNGSKIIETDTSEGAFGQELLWHVAETAGLYRLELRSVEKKAPVAGYEIRIEQHRPPTSEELMLVTAQTWFAAGQQLLAQPTSEKFKKAIEDFEKALAIWHSAGQQRMEAATLLRLGLASEFQGNDGGAINWFNRALSAWKNVSDLGGQASVLTSVSNIYIQTGDFKKAIDAANSALQLWRQLGDRIGEIEALNTLANLTNMKGDPRGALDQYKQLLRISNETGDEVQQGRTLNNLGAMYLSLVENERALECFERALLYARASGDVRKEAVSISNIGYAYKQIGEYKKALDHFNRSLELRRAVGDRRGEAGALANIGALHESMGNYSNALDCLNQSLAISRSLGAKQAELTTLNQIGAVYISMRDYTNALSTFKLGMVIAQTLEAPPLVTGAALLGIARVERHFGDLAAARKHIEQVLTMFELTRVNVPSLASRALIFERIQPYHEFYISLLMEMHKHRPGDSLDALALEANERARARSLVDMLSEARRYSDYGVSPVLLERERSLQQMINAGLRRKASLSQTEPQQVQQINSLEMEISGLLRAYEDVQTEIRLSNPRYAALARPVTLNLKGIQQQLAPDMLLLEYSLGEEKSFLWAVTPTSMKSFELPSRKDIESASRTLYDLLTARNLTVEYESPDEKRARIAKADSDFPAAAARLSDLLLGPAKDLLGNKRLLIVSDGALQFIPFAALNSPSTASAENDSTAASANQNATFSPLIVEHEIVDLPSASTLAVLRQEIGRRKKPSKTLAVIADPVFSPSDERVKPPLAQTQRDPKVRSGDVNDFEKPRSLSGSAGEARFENSLNMPRLPFTRLEASKIAGIVSPSQRRVKLDFAANRDAVFDRSLSEYQFIHFATHSIVDTVHPELSGIVLSLVDKDGREQDGFLRVYETFNLRLNADMVVLSACRTGLGQQIKGEGMLGFTRGFMYAGAQRVMVTLWAPADEATSEMMTETYGQIVRKRLRPAAALRASQLTMWRDKRWHAAFYWAAFSLRGEPN